MTMSTLNEYLRQKRASWLARHEKARDPATGPVPLAASVRAEGRSGLRRIRIRDFQIVSDSTPDFAGYDLGPGSPEILLGALGSCLTHSTLIQAADREVPLDDLSVDVTAAIDPRGGAPGFDHIPTHPTSIAYTLRIASPADAATIAGLVEAVERFCPLLNLLRKGVEVAGRVEHRATA